MFALSVPWFKLGTPEAFHLMYACSMDRVFSLTHTQELGLDYLSFLFGLFYQKMKQDGKNTNNASFLEQPYFHVYSVSLVRLSQYRG